MQTLSHKLLVRETCDQHGQILHAGIFKGFWAGLPDQKQLCVFSRNKYDFQIGYSMETNKLYFDQEEILKMA